MNKRNHQTQKPLKLMENLVKIVEPNGVILDPFMGSASIEVAALLNGQRFLGIEYLKYYYDIASKRLNKVDVVRKGIKQVV